MKQVMRQDELQELAAVLKEANDTIVRLTEANKQLRRDNARLRSKANRLMVNSPLSAC